MKTASLKQLISLGLGTVIVNHSLGPRPNDYNIDNHMSGVLKCFFVLIISWMTHFSLTWITIHDAQFSLSLQVNIKY